MDRPAFFCSISGDQFYLVAKNSSGAPGRSQKGTGEIHPIQHFDQLGNERGLTGASTAAQDESILLIVKQEGLDGS
ncbi:hypothetical protein D9M68_403700 [compost metagenome]